MQHLTQERLAFDWQHNELLTT